MRYFTLLCLACLLAACSIPNYYQQTIQTWRGGTQENLMARWGKPDEKITSPKGHIVLVYYTNRTRTSTPPSSPVVAVHVDSSGRPVMVNSPNTNYTWNRGPTYLACSTLFEVNASGKIIDAQSKGPGCYAGEGFAKRMGNS